MSRRQSHACHVSFAALAFWLAACALDSDPPIRSSSAAPVSGSVTLSGAGSIDVAIPVVGYGPDSRISDIDGGSGGSRASADGMPGGIDSGGVFEESAGDIGGLASSGGGAAGAGGSSRRLGSAGDRQTGGAAGGAAEQPPVLLWFSEYIEGSSSNKALEISAPIRVVLDGCKVGTYFNGKTEATVVATLSGVLEAGQVLTLCTSTLKEKLEGVCAQVGNLSFNGDDALVLSCEGKVLDVIGQIGVDPGDGWGSDANSTANHTLRRHCTVQSGDPLGTDAFEPSGEWQAFPVDTFDGLGTLGC